jgi:hypothetical protein
MGDEGADTLMWEVRAAEGRLQDLLSWVDAEAAPALRRYPGLLTADVFTASDERVVVIARFSGPRGRIPEPPAALLRREPHQWSFRHHHGLATG